MIARFATPPHHFLRSLRVLTAAGRDTATPWAAVRYGFGTRSVALIIALPLAT